MPNIEPIIPDNSCNRYVNINFIENVFLIIRDIIKDMIMYKDVNFIPSRYALYLEFLPSIIDDIKIDIIGINSFIIFVGNIKK